MGNKKSGIKNIYFLFAGIINFLTIFLHTAYGQIDLVNPLISSNLDNRIVGELVANWHIVSVLLIMTTYILIKAGFSHNNIMNNHTLKLIGTIYILISLPFIAASVWFSIFAAQWLFLLPIGVLTLIGSKIKTTDKS